MADTLERKEINGINSYNKGNYQEAFELLKEPAAWGLKGSQYTLGFMFLKGQYVQQSTLLGMGWLGVATEVETKDWTDQYNNFYTVADSKLKLKIDGIVKEYIKRYGMKAQNITCSKLRTRGPLEYNHKCQRSGRSSTFYPVDIVE